MTETPAAIADRLEALAAKAKLRPLSIPGDPSWPMERDEQAGAEKALRECLVDALPAILVALREMNNAG